MSGTKKVTKEEVEKLSKLINLPLSDDELEKYASLLSDTLSYIETINELDTSEVVGTNQVSGLENVFMADEGPEVTIPREKVLQNALEVIDDKFAAPAVFER